LEDDYKPSKPSSNRYIQDNSEEETEDADQSAKPAHSVTSESELKTALSFCNLIVDHSVGELRIPREESSGHERQYGQCRRPFGLLRMRVVEFLHETYRVFFRKEIHQIFLESDLYNSLLFYFDHYPFHNILHQKIADIFTYLLDKSQSMAASDMDSVTNDILYEIKL
jgi:hypothetical protein